MAHLVACLIAALLTSPALAGDEDGDKQKKAEQDPRVTVQIPIAGLQRDADAAYLRKVLRQKLSGRAETDLAGRDLILMRVDKGEQVSLTDLRRIAEKVAR